MRRSAHHCEVPPHACEELVACAVWYSSTSKGNVPHITHGTASATTGVLLRDRSVRSGRDVYASV
jgi:hypothetical protein